MNTGSDIHSSVQYHCDLVAKNVRKAKANQQEAIAEVRTIQEQINLVESRQHGDKTRELSKLYVIKWWLESTGRDASIVTFKVLKQLVEAKMPTKY